MRLYLSSFRLGSRPEVLVRLVGRRRPVAVIASGLDGEAPQTRAERVRDELLWLEGVGLTAIELDLRDHIGRPETLEDRLSACSAVWLRGGNVFLARSMLARSGADRMITDLAAADRLVVAGYSVAPAIAGPSLRGFECVDDPRAVDRSVGPVVWDGLGLVPQVVVPHCDSPGHPATDALTRLADDLERSGVAVIPIRDGQALVVDGSSIAVV